MVDLSYISGLPIQLDEDTNTIYYNDTVDFVSEEDIGLQEIIPVLLNKFLKYPEKVYTQHSKVTRSDFDYTNKNISVDLVMLPFGLLGIEYIKTHIYFSEFVENKYACFIEVVRGEVTVLIQKNKDNPDPYAFNTFVEKIDIINLSEGDRLAIPTGLYYTFINTGNAQTVFTVAHSGHHKNIDYSKIQKEKGLAFYIISKNARLEIVANPKYRIQCEPVRGYFRKLGEESTKFYRHKLIKKDEPLFESIKQSIDEFIGVLA